MVCSWKLYIVGCVLVLGVIGTEVPWRRTVGARRHYCGKDLSSALSVICDGWYKKRSEPPLPSNYKYLSNSGEDKGTLLYNLLSRKQALTMLSLRSDRRNKRSRGIVDECCHKPCYISELKGYCGSDED